MTRIGGNDHPPHSLGVVIATAGFVAAGLDVCGRVVNFVVLKTELNRGSKEESFCVGLL